MLIISFQLGTHGNRLSSFFPRADLVLRKLGITSRKIKVEEVLGGIWKIRAFHW